MENVAITLKNTKENEDLLISLGYEKRSGSCSYERPYITVMPFKLYYWEDIAPYSKVEDLKIYSS